MHDTVLRLHNPEKHKKTFGNWTANTTRVESGPPPHRSAGCVLHRGATSKGAPEKRKVPAEHQHHHWQPCGLIGGKNSFHQLKVSDNEDGWWRWLEGAPFLMCTKVPFSSLNKCTEWARGGHEWASFPTIITEIHKVLGLI